MPQFGEVLMQGSLGSLLPQIEAIIDPQRDEGFWVAFGPVGTVSFSENMFTAIIFEPLYEEDDFGLPQFALENHLEPCFEVHLMQHVIDNARDQKPDVTLSELVAALNYYSDHDAFLNFSTSS